MTGYIYGIYEDAVSAGVDPAGFWDMTIAEITAKVKAYASQREQKIKDGMFMAWHIGRLVAIGVNNPKKYPKWADIEKRLKAKTPSRGSMPAAEMEKRCRAFTLAAGGLIKETR